LLIFFLTSFFTSFFLIFSFLVLSFLLVYFLIHLLPGLSIYFFQNRPVPFPGRRRPNLALALGDFDIRLDRPSDRHASQLRLLVDCYGLTLHSTVQLIKPVERWTLSSLPTTVVLNV